MGFAVVLLALLLTPCAGAQPVDTDHHERRERAARAFPDGVVLLHASPDLPDWGDGFRQDPLFYYLTGLADTVSAILAIDGSTRADFALFAVATCVRQVRTGTRGAG